MPTKKAQQFRRFILDSIPVAMVTMDFDFKITSFNRRAEEVTGYSANEAVGRPCYEILQSSRCENNCPLNPVQSSMDSETGLEAEFVNRFGEQIPVRIGVSAIENDDGSFVGYLEVIEDISREKRMEREVVIRFQDQGCGIAPEELPYILDAFHRAESKSKYNGHGLGLAAVKAIVHQHGGQVSVESVLGKGSIFTVLLPKHKNGGGNL